MIQDQEDTQITGENLLMEQKNINTSENCTIYCKTYYLIRKMAS